MSRTRVLLADAVLAYKVFRELAKNATGVPVDAPLIAALFGLGVLANALRRVAAPMFRALRPRPASAPDALVAFAIQSAIVQRATGASAEDAPVVGAAMAVAATLPAAHLLRTIARIIPAAVNAVRRFVLGHLYFEAKPQGGSS